MLLKKIGSIAFGLAFLMAIVLFTGYGSKYISLSLAKILFLVFGGLGMFLNLLSFNKGKSDEGFNFIFWTGSLIIFIGFIFMMMHWPYSTFILLGGLGITGLSFIYSPTLKANNKEEKEELDQF